MRRERSGMWRVYMKYCSLLQTRTDWPLVAICPHWKSKPPLLRFERQSRHTNYNYITQFDGRRFFLLSTILRNVALSLTTRGESCELEILWVLGRLRRQEAGVWAGHKYQCGSCWRLTPLKSTWTVMVAMTFPLPEVSIWVYRMPAANHVSLSNTLPLLILIKNRI